MRKNGGQFLVLCVNPLFWMLIKLLIYTGPVIYTCSIVPQWDMNSILLQTFNLVTSAAGLFCSIIVKYFP